MAYTLAATSWRKTFYGSTNAESLTSGANTVTISAGALLDASDTLAARAMGAPPILDHVLGIKGLGQATSNAVWTLDIQGTVSISENVLLSSGEGTNSDVSMGAGLFNGFGSTSNKVTVGTQGTLAGADFGLATTARATVDNSGLIYGANAGIFFSNTFGATTELGDLATTYGADNVRSNLKSLTASITVNNKVTGVIASATMGDTYLGAGIVSLGQIKLNVVNAGKIHGGNDYFNNEGETGESFNGAIFTADKLALTNEATGVIDGNVASAWYDAVVTNKGVINGTIEMKTAVASGSTMVDIDRDGSVNDTVDGASAITSLTGLKLTNSGIIYGNDLPMMIVEGTNMQRYAVIGDDAKDSITNTGIISGVIDLQGGNDTVNNSLYMTSAVYMGEGRDSLSNAGGIATYTSPLETFMAKFPTTHFDTVYKNLGRYDSGPNDIAVSMGGGHDTLTNTGSIGEMVYMGTGNDVMTGSAKTDYVLEEDGRDSYLLGAGADYMKMGIGDTFVDTIDGGTGVDLLHLTEVGDGWVLNLASKTLQVRTGATFSATDVVTGFEQVIGGADNDSITGSSAAETISGGAGSDTITGGNGKDVLYGEVYSGGFPGGGLGGNTPDVFVFSAASDSDVARSGRDIIMDFAEGDKIRLTFDANTKTTTVNAFDYDGIQYGGFTKEGTTPAFRAGELRYHYEGPNTVLRGDTDGDGLANFAIEVKGQYRFTSDDFLFSD